MARFRFQDEEIVEGFMDFLSQFGLNYSHEDKLIVNVERDLKAVEDCAVQNGGERLP